LWPALRRFRESSDEIQEDLAGNRWVNESAAP
jgi:hypothetical protein